MLKQVIIPGIKKLCKKNNAPHGGVAGFNHPLTNSFPRAEQISNWQVEFRGKPTTVMKTAKMRNRKTPLPTSLTTCRLQAGGRVPVQRSVKKSKRFVVWLSQDTKEDMDKVPCKQK